MSWVCFGPRYILGIEGMLKIAILFCIWKFLLFFKKVKKNLDMSKIWVSAKGGLHICTPGHHSGHNTILLMNGVLWSMSSARCLLCCHVSSRGHLWLYPCNDVNLFEGSNGLISLEGGIDAFPSHKAITEPSHSGQLLFSLQSSFCEKSCWEGDQKSVAVMVWRKWIIWIHSNPRLQYWEGIDWACWWLSVKPG